MTLSLKKSTTLDQTDTWRKDRRLGLHHACIAHVVEMVNSFGSEDKHLLCADWQVYTSTYAYIVVHTGTYKYVPSCTDEKMYSRTTCTCFVEETALKKGAAAREEQVKSAVETRRHPRAAKAASK